MWRAARESRSESRSGLFQMRMIRVIIHIVRLLVGMIIALQATCQYAKSLISLRFVDGVVLVRHYGMPLAWR